MVDAINRISFRMTDWVMSPFESFSPWVGLVVFSFLTASVAVLAYKFCSDQSALQRRKSAAVGRLLEIRLYQEDLLGIFGTLRQLCGATGLYLAESLKPLAMLLVPVLLSCNADAKYNGTPGACTASPLSAFLLVPVPSARTSGKCAGENPV